MFRIIDEYDDFAVTVYTKEEAMVQAINHCITEGLTVISFTEINNEPHIVYLDPDNNMSRDINIFQVY